MHYRLKRIALETDTTIQDLLGEALEMLFEQYHSHGSFKGLLEK
ncbi:MAG: hypothetical protein OXH00_16850 [Candidatus Poribacteria bacterium]|nr:hypothetical protein [Candidatus Poribacteria bacterium]